MKPLPIIAGVSILIVLLAGIGIFLLLTGGDATEEQAAALSGESSGAAGPGVGVPVAQAPAGLPPQLPSPDGPLPVLPWQTGNVTLVEAEAAQSLVAIESAAPEVGWTLVNAEWVADEVTVSDSTALFIMHELAQMDAPLAGKVASLPWLRDDLSDVETLALITLRDIAAQDVATAAAVVSAPWVADGLEQRDQFTAAIVLDIARDDPALARRMVSSPNLADGVTGAELATFTGSDNYFLEKLRRDHLQVAEVVAGYAWLSDGSARRPEPAGGGAGVLTSPLLNDGLSVDQQIALAILEWFPSYDAELGRRVTGWPWVADDITLLEAIALQYLQRMALADVDLTRQFTGLPWVGDAELSRNEYLALQRASSLLDNPLLREAGEFLLDQPWFQDSISGSEAAVLQVMRTGCTLSGQVFPESFARQLIENPQVESRTLALPLGEVDLHVVSRNSLGADVDLVLQESHRAMASLEEFLGLPWGKYDQVIYVEPEYRYISDARGFYFGYVMVANPAEVPVLYHELAHHYSHAGPKWLVEGGASFLESYITHVSGGQSLQDRFDTVFLPEQRRCSAAGTCVNIHRRNQIIRYWTGAEWFRNRSLDYFLGEQFLLALYLELGHETVAGSLEELYLYGLQPRWEEWQGYLHHVTAYEEVIYEVMLSHTPPGREDDFRELYQKYHGRPLDYDPNALRAMGDRAALEAFYHATDGPNWTRKRLWLSDAPLYMWHGVSVSNDYDDIETWIDARERGEEPSGVVTHLFLPENGLSGPIPPELGNLPYLEQLAISGNQLTGPIPPELGNLANLEQLDLRFNQLTRPIPPELGNLTKLRGFMLGNNQLTGPMPPELGNLASLQWLELQRNRLSGPVPPELGRLSKLDFLTLVDNQLTGEIPAEWADLYRLESLYLSGNGLTGCLPDTLINIPSNDYGSLGLSFCGGAAVIVEFTGDENTDREALVALYHATGGPNWSVNANWLSDHPLQAWHGVSTDGNGRVTGLRLSNIGLSGQLPPELGSLPALKRLSIRENPLTGPIPPELGNLTQLTFLDLADNRLTGPIPPELGNLDNLDKLQLDRNQLEGPIPVELANLARLEYLRLGGRLTGPVPSWLVNLTNLEDLQISGDLTGPIPPELGSMTNLTSLFLGSNRLTGPIPPELANLTNLTGLGLAKNQLTGSIPPELGNMTSLEALYLNDNRLTGPVPPELADLPNLRALYLANDQLTGCVPPALLEKRLGGTDIHGGWISARDCDAADSPAAGDAATDRQALEDFYHAAGGPNWEQNDNWLSEEPLGLWHGVSTNIDGRVTELRLQRNGMSGSIPPELGDLAYLRLLMLHTNQLTGPIPPELANLSKLGNLHLRRNQLTGPIPPQLGNLTQLTGLDLADNQMTGPIPPELGNLTNLTGLHLAKNQLTGPIPPELGNLTNLINISLNNNNLTGTVPPELGNLTALFYFTLEENQLTGCIPRKPESERLRHEPALPLCP